MSIRSALMLAGALALVGFGSAHAQESAMKQCADKWQAAKAANTTGGLTYLQFSSKCRAELKAEPAAAAPAAPPRPPLRHDDGRSGQAQGRAKPAAMPAAGGGRDVPDRGQPDLQGPVARQGESCTPASTSTTPTRRRAAMAA